MAAEWTAGTQEQCRVALVHVERILRVKADLLNKSSKNRKIPRHVSSECSFSNCTQSVGYRAVYLCMNLSKHEH